MTVAHPPVRIVSVEAIPLASANANIVATGAYMNVYVIAPTDEEAIELARLEIAAAGWAASSPASTCLVDVTSLETGDEGFEYYEQCLSDGAVVVIHTWRHEH